MSEENLYTFENPQYRQTYWHTCAHVMAQAVKRLWPEVKLAIGPAIDEGWYYDFDSPFSFTQEHLEKIEAEMRKICKERLHLERTEKPRQEAIAYMQAQDEPYKVELIQDLPEDAVISFYTQGEFTDLCAGPHLDSTGRIKGNAIRLTQCCGAYWRGDSKRKMLQRIYGVAFPKKEELEEYLRRQEDVEDGQIAAVSIDGELTLKRVFKVRDLDDEGRVIYRTELRAENPRYAPIRLGGPGETRRADILGLAVAFRSRLT